MIVNINYLCTHCKLPAHEYEGLEGSIYVDVHTGVECKKSPNKEHNFVPVATTKKKSKHRLVTQGIAR